MKLAEVRIGGTYAGKIDRRTFVVTVDYMREKCGPMGDQTFAYGRCHLTGRRIRIKSSSRFVREVDLSDYMI